jgi:hypothetical protein
MSQATDELWAALSELCSLQCRVKTQLSPHLLRRQSAILQWLGELNPEKLTSLLTVDMNSSELKDIWEVVQFLLISEPKTFEKVCFLRWKFSQGQVRIELAKSSPWTLDRRDEYDLLNHIRVVWEGTKLIDVRFTNNCLVELILRLSDGQCLTRMPDMEGLYGLMWLRCKSRFSLAQLFSGLLELHVWKCWKLRNYKNFAPSTEAQLLIDRKRHGLSEVIARAPHQSNPLQALESAGCSILRSLVTEGTSHAKKVSGGSEVFPLYLQIMKQRILRSWYDPIRETFPYPGPYRNLWVLFHLLSIPSTGLCKFETKSLSNLAPHSGTEMVESLVSIPLLHSFSFYHEFKTTLCEKLLSDHAATLLVNEETLSHSQKLPHRPSKKKKRKPRKPKPVSPPTDSTEKCSKARSPSPTFVCLAADEVTPDLIRSTQTFTLCIQLLESIIDEVLEAQLLLDSDTPLNFKDSPLQSQEEVKSSIQADPQQSRDHSAETPRGDIPLSGEIIESGSLKIPWIFEDWGLPVISSGSQEWMKDKLLLDGAGFFEDVEESTMASWIRNHLPHGIVDGSCDGSVVTAMESRPSENARNQRTISTPQLDSKDSKFESSSLPTSPRMRDLEVDGSLLSAAGSGRNERAKSFTEAPRPIMIDSLRSTGKGTIPSTNDPSFAQSGRRRSDSLDPSHSRPPIQIFCPPSLIHKSAESSLGPNAVFQQGIVDLEDDDCSCDDTFQDTDSGLSFGVWSQEIENDAHGDKVLFNNTSPVLLALSCSLLRSHADSIVLRNIIALQKSLIMQPQNQFMIAPITTSNGMYFPLSYYPPGGNHLSGYGSNNMDFRNQARELEVR